jgi:hypothetical protein
VAEQARVLKSIARQQKSISKLPTPAEMVKMVNANIIPLSLYQTTMGLLGYSQSWIDAFTQLEFKA